jgi:ABC-type glycerol-3-phosphate transport system permease component
MLTLPDWLLDAAKLDGLSYFGIYRKVILPLSTPALVVAFLFQFIWVWNEMLFGMVLTHSYSTRPLMTQLAMLKGSYITSFGVMAAGAVTSIIVPVILVLVFQKKFTQGFIAPFER